MKFPAVTHDDESEESSRYTDTFKGEENKANPMEDSVSEAESGEEYDDDVDEDVVQREDVQFDEVELDPSPVSITQDELEDEDNELWLIRIPSHLVKPSNLNGKELFVSESREASSAKNIKAGDFATGYHFRDCGTLGTEHMRAAFVHEPKHTHERPRLRIAKPFARHLSVAFETDLKKAKYSTLPKSYPEPPSDIKLQFLPVGSKPSKRRSKVASKREVSS